MTDKNSLEIFKLAWWRVCSEAYSEPCQTSNIFKSLAIFAKCSNASTLQMFVRVLNTPLLLVQLDNLTLNKQQRSLPFKLGGVYVKKNAPFIVQPCLLGVSVSWDGFNFGFTWEVSSRFAEMKMSRGTVLSLVQFAFSYSLAIVTLNSTFILGLLASKSNLIKAICDL